MNLTNDFRCWGAACIAPLTVCRCRFADGNDFLVLLLRGAY